MTPRQTKLKAFVVASREYGDDSPEMEAALRGLDKKDRAVLEVMVALHIVDDLPPS